MVDGWMIGQMTITRVCVNGQTWMDGVVNMWFIE